MTEVSRIVQLSMGKHKINQQTFSKSFANPDTHKTPTNDCFVYSRTCTELNGHVCLVRENDAMEGQCTVNNLLFFFSFFLFFCCFVLLFFFFFFFIYFCHHHHHCHLHYDHYHCENVSTSDTVHTESFIIICCDFIYIWIWYSSKENSLWDCFMHHHFHSIQAPVAYECRMQLCIVT